MNICVGIFMIFMLISCNEHLLHHVNMHGIVEVGQSHERQILCIGESG